MVGALMTRLQTPARPMRVSPSRSWYAPGIPASTKDKVNNLFGVLTLFDQFGGPAGPLLQRAKRSLRLRAVADADHKEAIRRAKRQPMTLAAEDAQRPAAGAGDRRRPVRRSPHRVAASRVADRQHAVVGDVVQRVVLIVRGHPDAAVRQHD